MPRTHLCSQEVVFIIGRYRHAEWDCNCILFILKMITHGTMSKRLTLLRSSCTKMSSICRILSRVIIIQGRSLVFTVLVGDSGSLNLVVLSLTDG